ncbi:MAG TPA: alpha/beta fold hydrolase [Bacteroidota bacterium]|nr:alpha/beta fold hydrolase [Bacteroidota bacterium]
MHIYLHGVPFWYIDEGDRSSIPVIFLHGFPFSHEMWTEQVSLVAKRYRAIAYDLRGHGRSFVGDGQFTIEQHVDDLFGLMDLWKAEKPVIVGLSMGGYITLRALERDQQRFRAAVLCDTKSEADTNEGKLKRFENMKIVREQGSEAFAEMFVRNVFAAESLTNKPDAVQRIKKIIAATPPLSIAGTLLALAARTDTTAFLSQIAIPTLILVGEKDVTTPPAASQAMHEKIRTSEMHIIPNAAHMSNLENPEEFNRHLMAFLERVAQQ